MAGKLMGEGKYRVAGLVGKGSYGQVYVATRASDGSQVVIKRMNLAAMNGRQRELCVREAYVLRELHHPGVVSYLDSFVEQSSGELCLVTEFCEGGDMGHLITRTRAEKGKLKHSRAHDTPAKENVECIGSVENRMNYDSTSAALPEGTVLSWLVQLVLALDYVHDKHVLHRDLKFKNVFIKRNRLKLGDFGVSKELQGSNDFAETCIGTPYFMSPEVFRHEKYNEKSDIWSLGCLVHEMMTGRRTFEAKSLTELSFRVISGKFSHPLAGSPSMMHLNKRMLQVDPERRPSAAQILQLPLLSRPLRRLVASYYGDNNLVSDLEKVTLTQQLERLGLRDVAETSLPRLLRAIQSTFDAGEDSGDDSSNLQLDDTKGEAIEMIDMNREDKAPRLKLSAGESHDEEAKKPKPAWTTSQQESKNKLSMYSPESTKKCQILSIDDMSESESISSVASKEEEILRCHLELNPASVGCDFTDMAVTTFCDIGNINDRLKRLSELCKEIIGSDKLQIAISFVINSDSGRADWSKVVKSDEFCQIVGLENKHVGPLVETIVFMKTSEHLMNS